MQTKTNYLIRQPSSSWSGIAGCQIVPVTISGHPKTGLLTCANQSQSNFPKPERKIRNRALLWFLTFLGRCPEFIQLPKLRHLAPLFLDNLMIYLRSLDTSSCSRISPCTSPARCIEHHQPKENFDENDCHFSRGKTVSGQKSEGCQESCSLDVSSPDPQCLAWPCHTYVQNHD